MINREKLERRRLWSEEEREEALRVYEARGPAAVLRELGIPKNTVCSWAHKAGVSAGGAVERTTAANEFRRAQIAEKREQLRATLLDATLECVQRARDVAQPHRSKNPRLTAAAAKDWALAAAILLDKFRLESEETAPNTVAGEGDVRAMLVGKLNELAARRSGAPHPSPESQS